MVRALLRYDHFGLEYLLVTCILTAERIGLFDSRNNVTMQRECVIDVNGFLFFFHLPVEPKLKTN